MAKLTTLAARTLRPGEVLRDDVVKGLQLHGRESGAVWMYYYRTPAGQRRPKLGEWPALQIEAAREVARAMALEVAKGRDPSAERRAYRAAPTMDELFARYMEDHGEAKQSGADDERNWQNHVSPRVGKIKAADFDFTHADAVLRAVATPSWREVPLAKPVDGRSTRRVQVGGPVAHNRVRALLWGVLSYAERSTVKLRPKGSNIMGETKALPEAKRRRHIRPDEFPRIAEAIEHYAAEYPRHVAALRCTLYCGTRVSELLTAQRAWLDGHVLRLHFHKTMWRTGDSRTVRLPAQAVAIIASLEPDPEGRLFGPLDRFAVHKVWAKIRARAGIPDVQPRDLRRTFASLGATRGLELDAVGQLLGHSGDARVTAGYAYLFEDAAAGHVQGIADDVDRMSKRGADEI